MISVILAAGKGPRLDLLTRRKPKCLVKELRRRVPNVYFLSNNSSRHHVEFVKKVGSMGIDTTADKIRLPTDALCDALGATTDEIVFVGDRVYTDYEMASNCGSRFIGLLSGDASREDFEGCSNITVFTSVARAFQREA